MKIAITATHVAYASAWTTPRQFEIPAGVKAAVTGAAFSVAAAASPAVAADVGAGGQIFKANCASCHPGGRNIIAREKTLQKDALDQFLAGGRSEEAVANLVTNGKSAMPAFGKRLSDEERADVASYVIATAEAGWAE